MSLQLPTILSPPTPCTPVPTLTSRRRSGRGVTVLSLSGRLPFWASPLLSRLANASGRIEFIILLIMDWSFASGCSPPRLSATQFPSATDSQCSVRWGLPPHCWCALSGALSKASRLTLFPEQTVLVCPVVSKVSRLSLRPKSFSECPNCRALWAVGRGNPPIKPSRA
jgi:hypothetical protein